MKNVQKRKIKNVVYTLAFPLAAWAIMEIICLAAGKGHLIKTDTSIGIMNFVRSVGISTCTALALSFNLASGRFDLSLGAQRLMATIIGGNIALSLGLHDVGMVICVVLFGLLFGFIVGAIFVTTKVPPMVLGVGMTMVYECVAFVSSGGGGLNLNNKGYELLSGNVLFVIAIVFLAVSFVMVLFTRTKFGYDMRSIRGSQNIAYNSGIKVFKNVALCYMFAGGMVSFGGIFDAAFVGAMNATTGMSSNSTVMSSCFPMFLGGFLSRWSNQAIGILVSTTTLNFVSTGLAILNISLTATQAINMALFLVFLIINANQNVFSVRRKKKARVEEAMREPASAKVA